MSNIFIPAGVRDKAMRDTLIAIVREINNIQGIKVTSTDPTASTPGKKGDVIYSESSNSIWIFSNDNNWELAAGVSDRQAAEGYKGDTRFTGTLYYQTVQSGNPGAPTSATWSVPNDTFLSITPSGVWSHEQPPVSITDTSVREWSTNYTVVLDPSTDPISATITFTTPVGAIQVTDDIESDNYVPGTSGWAIRRDDGYAEFGAAAIRGTLAANQIAAGTIDASKLSSGSISGLGLTIGTLSDASSGERIVISDNKIVVFDSNNNIRVKIGDLS